MTNDAITAANHWRGQCLDNFARAEQAILTAYSHHPISKLEKPPTLHEAAVQRTRGLVQVLKQNWSNLPDVKKVIARLEIWQLREKERNLLAHGRFRIIDRKTDDWSIVNRTIQVKKGVAVEGETIKSRIETEAFLDAITAERKKLEEVLLAIRKIPA